MVLIMVNALLVLLNAILAMVHQEKRIVIHVILVSSTLPSKMVASKHVLLVTTQIPMLYNAFKQSELVVKFLQLLKKSSQNVKMISQTSFIK